MNEEQITAIASVLAKWNPLGDGAKNLSDLDGYRVEAADIIFGLNVRGSSVKPEWLVMNVLNQAFDLSLTQQNCVAPAQEIKNILRKW